MALRRALPTWSWVIFTGDIKSSSSLARPAAALSRSLTRAHRNKPCAPGVCGLSCHRLAGTLPETVVFCHASTSFELFVPGRAASLTLAACRRRAGAITVDRQPFGPAPRAESSSSGSADAYPSEPAATCRQHGSPAAASAIAAPAPPTPSMPPLSPQQSPSTPSSGGVCQTEHLGLSPAWGSPQ